MQLIKRMAALGLTVALSASATTISLSGIVKNSVTGNGLSGVKVSLAKAGLSPTTTLSDGSWTLSGAATGIVGRHVTAAVSGTSHLSVQDGHVVLRYEGHDLLGHSHPGASAATASITALARGSGAALDTIDTLLFSWKDTVRVRLPITSYVQSGITTVLDTTSTSTAVTGDTGHFTDRRDGQTYKWVKIGIQTWMAQNLNYKADSSWCSDNDSTYCVGNGRLYQWTAAGNGRLYQWAAAMGLDTSYNNNWLDSDSVKHQGICPSGWHVPSDTEWGILLAYVGADSARIKLGSTTSWSSMWNTMYCFSKGVNAYGFNILPVGGRYGDGSFYDAGVNAYFWSSSESFMDYAWIRSFNYYHPYVSSDSGGKVFGFSLRCVKDN